MPKPQKSALEKIRDRVGLAPLVSGPNVVTSAELAKALGTSQHCAQMRLAAMEKDGSVRKVRTKRGRLIICAWEYLGD